MATQIAPNAAASERMAAVRKFVLSSLIVMSGMLKGFASASTESKIVLRRLFEIPFTCIGLVCINIGFFEIIHVWAWITTGITMIILEAMIADKDDD
jgi:hypothetical protein